MKYPPERSGALCLAVAMQKKGAGVSPCARTPALSLIGGGQAEGLGVTLSQNSQWWSRAICAVVMTSLSAPGWRDMTW